jgi:hypothetical protein
MAIDTSTILDVLEDEKEDGTSIDDIYNFLLENEDIILVIDADQEEALRRGLTLVKARHQKKVQEQGLPPNGESKQLAFRVIEEVKDTEPKQIRIQIWLKKRSNVKVHRMIVSDKEL